MPDKSWREYIIRHPEGLADALSGVLFGLGCEGITEEEGAVRAYFPEDADTSAIDEAISAFEGVESSHRVVEDQDWYAGWKEGIGPFSVHGLYICPPWKAEDCHPGPGEKLVMMDPGEAFGTGDHESTVMVIGLLKGWAETQDGIEGKRILDLGTGTGILSIAAYLYGVKDITAVDVEQKAVETAGRNFALNGMVGKVRMMPGSINEAGRGYDLILANIFQEVLLELMPGISSALNPGGKVVVSGLLIGQEEKVLDAVARSGMKLDRTKTSNGWVSLTLSA